MSSIKNLSEAAKAIGFVDKMKTLGFELGPTGFWFYRRREKFIDFIDFWIKSSGNHMTVPVSCLKFEILENYDENQFPKDFQAHAPIYSDAFINEEFGVEIGGDPWRIKTADDIVESLNEIFAMVIDSADSWFKNIDSDKKLYESFSIRMQETEKGEMLRKLLAVS